MAGSKSDYYENICLQHLFKSDYSAPANTYIALCTAAPTDSAAGTEVDTGTWTNYARTAVARNTGWTLTGNTVVNAAEISFGTATVSGTAPVVVAFKVMDASTAGNCLYWGDLTTARTVENSDPVSFAAGALTITED